MGCTKLSVILIIVCAVKCLAMTYDELEDFADYLKKTSQLSPTLKKGVDPDDYDEDEVVSDHAWEDSGKFEGDLVLNERQRRMIVENVAEGLSRNGLADGTKRWPNNEVVFYIQVEHFTKDQVQAIREGIEDLAGASCVKFRPYKKGDRDAVVIQGNRRGCFSQVGYQGGYQVLNLSGRHPVGRGCFRHGTVVHEMLHTLGFYHMQSSPDRDDYVEIMWGNIVQQARHNFRKYNSFSVSDFGVGYDYDSVLHYSRRAFSSNGQDTIVPKQRGVTIGQRKGLSDKDTEKLNKMYCDANSDEIEDDDETRKRIENKKKKNKPFKGQGIGYHQGKTVAIKLSPTPETYKITDVPSYHVFDHFSKTPEILPSSEIEGIRVGKEITYSYNPSELLTSQEPKLNDYSIISDTKINNLYPRPPKDSSRDVEHIHHYKPSNNREVHGDKEVLDAYTDPAYKEAADPELYSSLDSLSKILKTHVYPSHTPDLSIYKTVSYHGHYDNPGDRQSKVLKRPNQAALKNEHVLTARPKPSSNHDYKNINSFKTGKTQPHDFSQVSNKFKETVHKETGPESFHSYDTSVSHIQKPRVPLQSHVTPSEAPDLTIYKTVTYHGPRDSPESKKIATYKIPSSETKYDQTHKEKMKSAVKFIDGLYEYDTEKPYFGTQSTKFSHLDDKRTPVHKPSPYIKKQNKKQENKQITEPTYSSVLPYKNEDTDDEYFTEIYSPTKHRYTEKNHEKYNFSPPKYDSDPFFDYKHDDYRAFTHGDKHGKIYI